MAFLTDRTLATGVTFNDLIHIVNTSDTSQNPAGSSYKATLGQFISILPPFTGGSGNCITDFYVTNIYGCSPITIQSELNFNGSTAIGTLSFAQGQTNTATGNYSHSEGVNTNSLGIYSHAEGNGTQSVGDGSHSEGQSTITYGNYSHAEGNNTISNGDFQLVVGQYNSTASTQSAFIIGNGISNVNRSNLLLAAGNQVDIYGNLLVTGSTSANTSFITSTPTTASTLSEVIVRDSSSGQLKKYDFTHTNFGLFAQTGNSTTITATVTESTLIDGGIGNLTVPANGFKQGDSFRMRMGGVISAANGETLTIRVKTDSIVLGNTTITFPNTTTRNWMLDVDFTIRTTGSTTVASMVSNGFFQFNTASDILGGGFVTINNTTFDTTISNTLNVTAQWGSTNASNSIYSTNFVLTKTF